MEQSSKGEKRKEPPPRLFFFKKKQPAKVHSWACQPLPALPTSPSDEELSVLQPKAKTQNILAGVANRVDVPLANGSDISVGITKTRNSAVLDRPSH